MFSEVHAAGMFRQSDIETIVYKNSCSDGTCSKEKIRNAAQGFASERGAIFSAKVFLANLNPINACFSSGCDFFEQWLERF